MNERLKKLMLQCYETGPIGRDGWPEYNSLNEAKFVELFVKECKDLLFESSENNCLPIAVDDMIHIIDTHFGVEE